MDGEEGTELSDVRAKRELTSDCIASGGKKTRQANELRQTSGNSKERINRGTGKGAQRKRRSLSRRTRQRLGLLREGRKSTQSYEGKKERGLLLQQQRMEITASLVQ